MNSASLGLIVEFLVAILLVVTIGYCMLLNKRLKHLRADEHLLKATIGELLAATEVAERAIIGLKATTREAEVALGSKLRDAQKFRNELAPVQPHRPAVQAQSLQTQTVAPSQQQVATALRGLEQELSQSAQTDQQTPRDFRMFTRTSPIARNG